MTKMIHNTDNNLFHLAFAKSNAPINVNPVEGGGGSAAKGGDLMPETTPCRAFDRAKRPRSRDI